MSRGEKKGKNTTGAKKMHRRWKKRLKVFLCLVLILVGFVVVKSFSGDKNAPISVYTDNVSTGDIDTEDRKSVV